MAGDKIGNRAYYVCMTDRFMSYWGMAEKKTNKLVIGTDDHDIAVKILNNARRRTEMKYINLNTTKPRYGNDVYVSYKEPSTKCLAALLDGDTKYIY